MNVDTITHRTLRNQSAEILRRVAEGEHFLVTNGGAPVALLTPAPPDGPEVTRARLVAAGVLDPRPKRTGDRPAPLDLDVDLAALLDADRSRR